MVENGGNTDIVYFLFYWTENNRHIFSRSKFLSIISFVVCFIACLNSPPLMFDIIFALVVSVVVFAIGVLIHYFVKIDSSFYEGNLLEDIKHFLFYWYETNRFRLSKTKIVTVAIMTLGILSGLYYLIGGEEAGYVLASNLISLIFGIPLFLIGYAIHRDSSKNSEVQPVPEHNNNQITDNANRLETVKNLNLNGNNSNMPPKFVEYKSKIEELKKEFDEKELKTKELISAKFTPPQITYDRFMAVVDNCCSLFNEQYVAASNVINLGNDDSKKIDDEINSKIDIMESFIDKLDDLSNELVLNISKSKNDDINSALNDMEKLIASINKYED